MRLIDPISPPSRRTARSPLRTGNLGRAQSGGLLLGLDLDQHPHNITLFHDKVLDAIDLDLGARPLAERDAVADPDVDGVSLPVSSRAAGSNGDDLAGCGFSWVVSGMSSTASFRSMTTRS